MITATVDTTGFKRMAEDLARMSGKDFASVIRPEGARVIEKAIEYTPRAKPKKGGMTAEEEAKRRNARFGDGPTISVTRTDGKVWWLEKDDRYVDPNRPRIRDRVPHFHRMNDPRRRWNSERWAAYRAMEMQRQRAIQEDAKRILDERKAIKKAAGLSKNSWYQIGQTLRLQMRGIPQYVMSAEPSTGKHYQNGKGSEHSDGKAFFLLLENRYPALASPKRPGMNGHNILQRAVNTRLKAFENNMRHGVYNDLKARAQRHPGVFVLP